MRQDTDVVAIDSLQTVEDVHLAVEAAGLGKLVIATFAGGRHRRGVRRMLDLGAEPVSLASALTLGVGQRARAHELPELLGGAAVAARRDRSPALHKGMSDAVGERAARTAARPGSPARPASSRCCRSPSRFAPRSRASASEAELECRRPRRRHAPHDARDSTKVQDGLVSPEELDRVLRFSE